ncbi:MAG: PIG-L family deacetylase [Chromatiales bacterium]|jgi:LmbE family N-acetylglucosaminyl deacetylase|nr:PIG-L family deacetylase [Chromatiales bacterium]
MIRGRRFPLGIVSLLAIVAVVFVSLEFKRRHDLYWYDVGQDYNYAFQTGSAGRASLLITQEGFRFPDTEKPWDTALLPIRVAATVPGHWIEPSIEIRAGRNASQQVFERGARGLRYLLLNADLAEPGEAVSLTGSHLRWSDQGAELLLFSSPQVSSGRILVVAPHPDDAEIAAFGLYSSHDAYVVTVSPGNYVDGRYAHLEAEASAQDSLRGRVRAWDSLVVPTWGGVQPDRIANLGYWNHSLEGLYERRSHDGQEPADTAQDPNRYRSGAIPNLIGQRRAEPTWASLVGDFRALLETVRPSVIVAPHPALDAAADHQFTTIALLEALGDVEQHQAVLLLYTNHHVLSEHYPFGPADSAVTLPPWFHDETRFGGVFSFELSARGRQDKLFALEAMHDLRAAPRTLSGGPAERFLELAGAALHEVIRNPLGTYSYFRRAVRPNELFFVYRPEDRTQLGPRAEEGPVYP